MKNSGTPPALVPQAEAGDVGPGWRRNALRDVGARLTDPGFPCVFARNAYRKGLLRFVFADDGGPRGIEQLGTGLTDYVQLSRRWDDTLDTAYPLVAVFAPDAVPTSSLAGHHAFGWRVLQDLHARDPEPWPEGVGKDPESASWSLCFNGMALFVNMSSPAHRVRRSRNLGRHFALVINPRERFDVFAGDTPSGRKVRANIRGRIGRYDGTPHAPQLGSYGAGALEWLQYGLVEENRDRTDRCPFAFRGA
ncbi:YqcI/YcgG family protein [Kitasatospora sp. NPDC056446]|uniref:YqcI/YcgG family protein n=1 Tax=Kitasatospora sp. NPDC056446 TaxID=3345819 RepID=UPI0036B76518